MATVGTPWRLGATAFAAALLNACATSGLVQDGPPRKPLDVSQMADPVPRAEPLSRYGNPDSYVVWGQRYYTLKSRKGYKKQGIASWYGTKFQGRRTSSGEPYDMYKMTAAHRTLPLPTYAEVKNLENGRRIVVRINDRGPFHPDRIIDLSYAAAVKLGMAGQGTARVEVRAIEPSNDNNMTPASTIATAERVFVQVGAFASHDNALQLKARLEGAAIDGPVEITEMGEKRLFRVRIGPMPGTEVARNMTEALNRLGIEHSTIIVE